MIQMSEDRCRMSEPSTPVIRPLTSVIRHPDWPQRLGPFLARYRSLPFTWGRSDCVLFAADWVREATGVTLWAAELSPYRSAAGAICRLATVTGTADLIAAVSTVLPSRPVLSAARGDLAAILTPAGPSLAVVIGAQVAVRTLTGLDFPPLFGAVTAWRIG